MKRTWFKYLGGGVGVIILGAIGSGLWAEVLSPLWNMLTDAIVKLFSLVSASFTNTIYSEAAKGFHEEHSLTLLLFLMIIMCVMALSLLVLLKILKNSDKTDKVKNTIDKFFRLKPNFVVLLFIALLNIILLAFISIQMSYVNKVTTNSLNSISIVAPHIGIQQTLELRSMFHSIETSDDYKDFYKKLKTVEKAFKLKLPVSAPL